MTDLGISKLVLAMQLNGFICLSYSSSCCPYSRLGKQRKCRVHTEAISTLRFLEEEPHSAGEDGCISLECLP